MNDFENWLVENYGYEANGIPILHAPPRFVRSSDEMFDVAAYDAWKEQQRKENYEH